MEQATLDERLLDTVHIGLAWTENASLCTRQMSIAFDDDVQQTFQRRFLDSFLAGQQTTENVKLLSHGNVTAFKGQNGQATTLGLGDVVGEILRGRTIAVNYFERCMPVLAARFEEIARQSGLLCHMNVYWTPPSNGGAGRHSDDHDVAVLQVYGSKRWAIWQDAAKTEIDLQAADFLFLKRGIDHDPTTSGQGSIHITFGFVRKSDRHQLKKTLTFYQRADDVPESGIDADLVPAVVDSVLNPNGLRRPVLSNHIEVRTSLDAVRYESASSVAIFSKKELKSLFNCDPRPGHQLSLRPDISKEDAFDAVLKLALAKTLTFGATPG